MTKSPAYALVAVMSVVALTGILATTAAAAPPVSPRSHVSQTSRTEAARTTADHTTITPITVAAVGDSITAWIDRSNVANDLTWVSHVSSPKVTFTGEGWAKGGAQLAEMRANVVPITAEVLVVMAGTNDLGDRWGTPMGERLTSLDAIVDQSHAATVMVSAVAPRDDHPEWAVEWNQVLQAHAATNGWLFVDPWGSIRDVGNRYLPGLTIDGIHPTKATSIVVAAAIRSALVADLR